MPMITRSLGLTFENGHLHRFGGIGGAVANGPGLDDDFLVNSTYVYQQPRTRLPLYAR